LSKILDTFIGGWMLDEISGKFNDCQFGAVKGRSTTHELVNILHICHQAADNQKITKRHSLTSLKRLITLITK